MRRLVILFLGLAILCYFSINATGEPIADPSQLSPNPTLIDFETISNFTNPLIIGEVTFTSVTASLSLLNVNTPNWPIAGVEVAGQTLFPGGEPDSAILITFANPVSEFLLGWGDPNFPGNFLRAYGSNGQLLEEIEVPFGLVGGVFATWVGFKRPTPDIVKVLVQPDINDDYVIDNIHYNTIQSCVQPPSGLVSWWPLDEANGITPDFVGENDGTVNGPIRVAGKVTDALSFDGVDDNVDLGNDPSLNIPGSVTVDAWVKLIGMIQNWYGYFIADFSGGWTSQLSLGIMGSPSNFKFYSYEGRTSSDNTYAYSAMGKTSGIWYHVAAVRDDATKLMKMYVNGVLEGSASYAGKAIVPLQGHKYLGWSGTTYHDHFNGVLDEVEIFNRALTDSEIQNIYLAGSAGKCKGLTVTIDIKPGGYPNSINPRNKGKIPVAILSTNYFGAPSRVDPNSLTFGRTGDEKSLAFCNKPEDVNGDGLKDLICHFYTESADFQCGDTEGILKGQTKDDMPIEGEDSVKIGPCK